MYTTKGFCISGAALMLCIFGLNATTKLIEAENGLQVELISKVSSYETPKSTKLG